MKADPRKPDKKVILAAVKALKSGKLIIFPTETVYGLAADPFNKKAVEKLLKLKKRPRGKPLQLLISDIKQIKSLVKKIPAHVKKIIKRSWPGPLTLILPKKRTIPDFVAGNLNTVGIRMPDHPVALELIRSFGAPIAATSANISGQKPPKTAKQAIRSIKKGIALVIDSGKAKLGKSSRVLDATKKKMKLLRS